MRDQPQQPLIVRVWNDYCRRKEEERALQEEVRTLIRSYLEEKGTITSQSPSQIVDETIDDVLYSQEHVEEWAPGNWNVNPPSESCLQCGEPNPPWNGKGRKRKFCSKKCGKKHHSARYVKEQRYYTPCEKANTVPNWGKQYKVDKEDRIRRRKEYEWHKENSYSLKRIAKLYGVTPSCVWVRAKAWGIEPLTLFWRGKKIFFTKEEAHKLGTEHPPPQQTDPARLAHCREYRRRPEVRAANAAYRRKRKAEDPAYRLRANVSALVYDALVIKQGRTKGGSTFAHLPYTPMELKEHIEKQFSSEMSWDNYGSYWQVDHIIPQAALIYDSLTHPNFQKCWALDNLQPLERTKNASKGSFFNGKRHTYKNSS